MACGAGLKRTRFAPSPTGPLHLGHAYSALVAHERADPGEFLIRIEDIDQARCRPGHEAAIFEDLRWLGLDWPEPVLRQSDRLPAYRAAVDRLATMGLVYPCRCRRGDIRAALSAPQEGAEPAMGPDGPVYPGTCRGRPMAEAGPQDALRLDLSAALDRAGIDRLSFAESGPGLPARPAMTAAEMVDGIGDAVLARRDIGTSYHVAVVVDDAAQGITEVVRGVDLLAATFLHVLLQVLLELPTPSYHHHALIRDEAGRRLAKRDDARALSRYRAEGATPADLRRMVGLPPG